MKRSVDWTTELREGEKILWAAQRYSIPGWSALLLTLAICAFLLPYDGGSWKEALGRNLVLYFFFPMALLVIPFALFQGTEYALTNSRFLIFLRRPKPFFRDKLRSIPRESMRIEWPNRRWYLLGLGGIAKIYSKQKGLGYMVFSLRNADEIALRAVLEESAE